MIRHKLFKADDTLIIGPERSWVITRYRALYGRDPLKVEHIKLEQPRFVAGPVPTAPDTRWIPFGFLETIPA
jgi:hypothetical protein